VSFTAKLRTGTLTIRVGNPPDIPYISCDEDAVPFLAIKAMQRVVLAVRVLKDIPTAHE
jgi:hypothetical protein